MGGIDQRSQLIVGVLRVLSKARVRAQEMVNAVSMVRAVFKGHVLEDGAEPDGACSESLNIRELLLNAREISALKTEEVRVIKGLVTGSGRGVVKPVHHQEVN